MGKTLEARGYQPHVTVLSMLGPVRDLEKLITLDDTGRVFIPQRPRMQYHDVLSAFSMSYSGGVPLPPPPLARPRRQPSINEEGERRHSIIKPELRDPEVKELPSTAVVEPAATRPHQDDDEPMRRNFQE